MKALFASLLLLVSTSAFASVNVGDIAVYDGKVVNLDMDFAMSQNIINYNANTDMFLVRQEVQFAGGDKNVDEEWTKSDDLLDRATLELYVARCGEAGGQNETITVRAGTFNTCRLAIEGGHAWLGVVPFGLVQYDVLQDGNRIRTELGEYAFGQE